MDVPAGETADYGLRPNPPNALERDL